MNRLKRTSLVPILVAASFCASSWAQSSEPHRSVAAANLEWANVPSLPNGARIAVIEGPMNQAIPFTVRLKFPANYRIPPHTHPAIERVTVLSGTFHMGIGGKFERNGMHAVGAGDMMIMQPGTPHFAWAETETVVQLHGMGPWGITYLNAADDPRNR